MSKSVTVTLDAPDSFKSFIQVGLAAPPINCSLSALLIMSLQSLIIFWLITYLCSHFHLCKLNHYRKPTYTFYNLNVLDCPAFLVHIATVYNNKYLRYVKNAAASFLFYGKWQWVGFNGFRPAVFLSSLCVRWARTPQCCSSVSQCFSPTSPKLASTPVSSSISNRYNTNSTKTVPNYALSSYLFFVENHISFTCKLLKC